MGIEKQIQYWLKTSEEDLGTAGDLMEKKRWRPALFFSHLALEKILKALVCHNTNEFAPNIHNLIRLAEIAGLKLTGESQAVLARMNMYNIVGRYPHPEEKPLEPVRAIKHYEESIEVYQCLKKQLGGV